jgi:hypothetical protein
MSTGVPWGAAKPGGVGLAPVDQADAGRDQSHPGDDPGRDLLAQNQDPQQTDHHGDDVVAHGRGAGPTRSTVGCMPCWTARLNYNM